jgi:hypothetical protein
MRLLTETAPTLLNLRNEHASLGMLLGNLEGNLKNQHLIRTLGKTMDAVGRHLENLRRRLRTAPYPLDHAKADISIGEYMLAELPPADDLGAIFQAGRQALEALPALYVRLIARLAAVAEEVEMVLGLEPLPAPPKDGSTSSTAGGTHAA